MTRTLKLISCTIAVGLCVSSCKLAGLKRVQVAPEPVKVTVMPVMISENISTRSYVGTVEAGKQAVVETVHGGTVQKIEVMPGQKVAASQLLAEINSPTIESAYAAAKAAEQQAVDGYERAGKVFGSGTIPELKMVEIRTKLEQARASLDAAVASREECNVRAPFSGTVSEVFIHEGEHVTIGEPLFSIIDANSLEIVISVPENEISGTSVRDRATVIFPSLDNCSVTATVKSKGLVANVLSHSYKCSLSLTGIPEGLMCGMVCKVCLEGDVISGMVIPADVIKISPSDKYVWVVDDSGKVEKRIVVTGGYSGQGIVVTSGLEDGDRVILDGMDKVSAGMEVAVQEN